MKTMTIMVMSMIMLTTMMVIMTIITMVVMVIILTVMGKVAWIMVRFLCHPTDNTVQHLCYPVLASPSPAGLPAVPSVDCATYIMDVIMPWLFLFVSPMFRAVVRLCFVVATLYWSV